jgi:hypothetical protein
MRHAYQNRDERFVTPVRDSLTSHAMPDLVEGPGTASIRQTRQ